MQDRPNDAGVANSYVTEGPFRRYNAARGFGFVVPMNGEIDDVMLHIEKIREAGHESVPEEYVVKCEAVLRPGKGWRAVRVISISAPRPLLRGFARFYLVHDGYGFIEMGDGTDAFIGSKTMRQWGLRDLPEGREVYVRVRPSTRGDGSPEVYEIRLGRLSR